MEDLHTTTNFNCQPNIPFSNGLLDITADGPRLIVTGTTQHPCHA